MKWHLGTESGDYFYGPITLTGSLRLEVNTDHAYLPHLSYEGECRTCEQPEQAHHSAYQVAEYLKATVRAYRTLSVYDMQQSNFWWNLMSEPARVLAFQVLRVTGTEVW